MEEVEVTVLFFAGAREATGARSTTLRVAAGTTPLQLAESLIEGYGADFARVLETSALWVNGVPQRPGQVLESGDEVAVLPPVSGG
jgi:molybdopterin synthase sulfur carrier subunit